MKIVDIASLTIVQELGKGGQGTVHLVRAARQVGPPEEYAYKEYRRNGPPIDYANLGRLTEFTDRLEAAEQDILRRRTAWPLAVVGGQAHGRTGFLMPLVPGEFFFTHHRSAGPVRAIAEFQHLLNGPQFATRLGFHHTPADLYELLGKTAETLDFLHRRGVAVGDISPKNICFRLRPTPEVYLLDCDAMTLDGRSVSPQLETPGWEVPKAPSGARAPLGTRESDAYKFGLLVLRTLAGDQEARDPSALPPGAPGPIRDLLGRALAVHPHDRPAIGQWASILQGAARSIQLAGPLRPAPRQTTTVISKERRPELEMIAGSAHRAIEGESDTPEKGVERAPNTATSIAIFISISIPFLIICYIIGEAIR